MAEEKKPAAKKKEKVILKANVKLGKNVCSIGDEVSVMPDTAEELREKGLC